MAAGRQVVVADADAAMRNLVQLTLAGPGWSVREAEDATGAIRAVAAAVPDVLVVEATLPTAGAGAVIRALRQQPATAAVAVVLLTDLRHDPPADAVTAADAVVARPFGPLALLDAVEAALAPA